MCLEEEFTAWVAKVRPILIGMLQVNVNFSSNCGQLYGIARSDLYTFTNDWAKTFSNRQELEMTHNDKWNVWGNFMPGFMMGHQVLYGYRFTVVQ